MVVTAKLRDHHVSVVSRYEKYLPMNLYVPLGEYLSEKELVKLNPLSQ